MKALILPLAMAMLQACAPAEIEPPGTRADEEYNARIAQGIDSNASLRNPYSGHRADRLFYNLNRVQTYQNFQQKTQNALAGDGGGSGSEQPNYRAMPRDLSPFRQ